MGLLNYLGGRGSSAGEEGSSRHFESDVGGVTVGGVALEEEKSWEQPDPSVDNVPFTSFDEARPSDSRSRRSSAAADRDNVVDALERDFDVTIPVEGRPLVPNSLHQIAHLFILTTDKGISGKPIRCWWQVSILFVLIVLIGFQTACGYGIFLGLVRGSCIDSDDCSHGYWCDNTARRPNGAVANKYFALCNRCDMSTLIARRAVGLFVLVMICIGFLDTLADPEEGRRVLSSCGVKSPSRLRSTLTALLIWAVMVSAVRALALAAFVYITRFNVDNRVGEI